LQKEAVIQANTKVEAATQEKLKANDITLNQIKNSKRKFSTQPPSPTLGLAIKLPAIGLYIKQSKMLRLFGPKVV